jgi:glutamate racemase
MAQGIDTLILGCTHYPLLKNAISRACGLQIQLVDSGTALCERLEKDFKDGVLARDTKAEQDRRIDVISTDLSAHTKAWAQEIMAPLSIDAFHQIDL